jgi:hypothetical protein
MPQYARLSLGPVSAQTPTHLAETNEYGPALLNETLTGTYFRDQGEATRCRSPSHPPNRCSWIFHTAQEVDLEFSVRAPNSGCEHVSVATGDRCSALVDQPPQTSRTMKLRNCAPPTPRSDPQDTIDGRTICTLRQGAAATLQERPSPRCPLTRWQHSVFGARDLRVVPDRRRHDEAPSLCAEVRPTPSDYNRFEAPPAISHLAPRHSGGRAWLVNVGSSSRLALALSQ